MRFFLTFTLILTFGIVFSQDSCFMRRTPSMDDYIGDTTYPLTKRINEYVNSFNGCVGPEFNATTLRGEKISSRQLIGKVIVLNFWFTHCKPCVGEFPSLNKLASEYSEKGVEFISFALDSDNVLDSFLVQHPLKYDIVPSSKKFAELFKVWPYPTNIILGKDFKVAKGFRGGTTLPEEALKNYELIKPVIDAELAK